MVHPIIETDDFTFDKFKAEIALNEEEKKFEYLTKAYKGDYWQDGSKTLFPEISKTGNLLTNIQSRYVSKNGIKECVERVSGAFLGQRPIIKFIIDSEELSYEELKLEIEVAESNTTRLAVKKAQQNQVANTSVEPLEGEESETNTAPEVLDIEEIETKALEELNKDKEFTKKKKIVEAIDYLIKIINRLWIKEGYQKASLTAFETSLLNQRGGIRVYPILKKIDDNKATVEAKTLTEAAKKIRIEYVQPGDGIFLNDNGEKLSIFLNKIRTDYNKKTKEEIIELSYIDDDGNTIISTLKKSEVISDANSSAPLALGESTTYYEMKGNYYITDQFFMNNQLMNLAMTCAGFNVLENGFGEMVITNVEQEMETKYNPATGQDEEVPKPVKRGGAVINNFQGVSAEDAQGNETISNPGVYFKNPSPMTSFGDAKNLAYENCLEEVGQLYSKISGDATASAISRVQALSDFYLKIKRFRPDVDCMLTWMLNLVVKFIIAIDNSKTLSELEDIEIIAQAKVKVATLTIEEKQVVISMCGKGIISKDTARMLLEVDNYDQEKQKIVQEKIEADQLLKQINPQLAQANEQNQTQPNTGNSSANNNQNEPTG